MRPLYSSKDGLFDIRCKLQLNESRHPVHLEGAMDHIDKTVEVVNPLDVARKLKMDYSQGWMDHTTKALSDICGLCWRHERSDKSLHEFLTEVADLISKEFGIASVTIAVRDPVDKMYRYKVVNGIDNEAIEEFMRITYSIEQVNDTSTYPGHEISSHTKIFLAEEHPYAPGEEFSYKRPGLIGMRRRALGDSLEADYIDFFFYGPNQEILGWIETSGTRQRKLPDAATIRWIELIAYVVGQAVRTRQ